MSIPSLFTQKYAPLQAMELKAAVSDEFSPFSACDKIAEYYSSMNTPSRESYGPMGGKSYTWYVSDSSQSFQVFCACNIATLGLGVLQIKSRMASEVPSKRYFTSTSPVNKETSKVILHGVLMQRHEIRLPSNSKHS
jgi:hypothetical protein